MPDGGIIVFLFLFGIIALICLANGWKDNWADSDAGPMCAIAVILFVAGFLWLRVADTNRAEEVDWFFLHTITCVDGTTTQLFIDGDDIFNVTALLGKIYPGNGWAIERRRLEYRKFGIAFDALDSETSYRAIAPNEASPPKVRIENDN